MKRTSANANQTTKVKRYYKAPTLFHILAGPARLWVDALCSRRKVFYVIRLWDCSPMRVTGPKTLPVRGSHFSTSLLSWRAKAYYDRLPYVPLRVTSRLLVPVFHYDPLESKETSITADNNKCIKRYWSDRACIRSLIMSIMVQPYLFYS